MKKFLAKFTRKILDCAIMAFAYFTGFYLSLMSDKIFFYNVKFLAFLFRIFDRRRRRDCITNLNLAFGDSLPLREKNRILNRAYDNFAFVILNAARLICMPKEKYIAKFRVHNENLINDLIAQGNFVFITAHYGDWEGTARYVAHKHKEINLSVVGRLTQFDSVNNLMEKSRQKFGSFFLDRRGAGRKLVSLLKDKRNVIGLVIDQNMALGEGIDVRFFGKEVSHTPAASTLARKYKIPIICVYMRLNSDYSKYDLYFEKVCDCIITSDSKADILAMTQAQSDFTEKIIRQKPDEWFWFHRRFKGRYSELYK